MQTSHALTCAVSKEEEDYSRAEDHGNRAAFDIDLCKAVAVAILGPGARFVVKAYPDEPGSLKALKSGEVDLVASASPTISNTVAGFAFTRPTFYDSEGLMILNNPAIHTAADLAGKKVCFLIETATETGLRTWAARQKLSYIWYPFSEAGEMDAAFFTGNCAALAGDVSQLANARGHNVARAREFTILPDVLRTDPLAPAYLASDPRFGVVVDWTVEALIEAEQLHITAGNVDQQSASVDAEVQQLLGQRYGTGDRLGLDDHWAQRVIEAVGNFGEIFDRDLGTSSPLRLDRGMNRLAREGGVLLPLPVAAP